MEWPPLRMCLVTQYLFQSVALDSLVSGRQLAIPPWQIEVPLAATRIGGFDDAERLSDQIHAALRTQLTHQRFVIHPLNVQIEVMVKMVAN
jgi:hypothetical protein